MSSFFRPTTAQGAKTPAIKAPTQNARTLKTQGKKAISLSLLLGMTPALAVTPAVHADAAPAKPAQVEPPQADPASTASPAASDTGAAEAGAATEATGISDADKIDLKVTTGTLNISQGGTVSVTTSPLTPEFRKKYKLFQFGLVNRGTDYEWSRTGEATQNPLYRGRVDHLREDGIVHDNPDGSITFTFEVKKQTIRATPSPALDVVLTYYPAGEREPNAEEYEDPRLTARTPLSLTQDPEPDHTTYVYSMPAIDNPWVDTQLTIEGYHILSKQLVEPGSAPAYLTLYEVDPATGKMVGKPVFTHAVRYTDCGEYYCWSFLNNYFSADVTIPAGTLQPGKSYMIGVYSGLFPNPDEEKVPGSLLTDVAPFIPVRSPNPNTEVKDAAPVLRVEPQQMDQYYSDSPQVSPYWEKNTLQVRAVNLPKLTEGHYRFSLQATDTSGNLTGQKALEQDIAADRIQSGYTEATLTVPGEALNYQGGYKLVVEKVLPGQGGAADSVQQVVSTDLGLVVNAFEEREAAKRWYKAQQLPKSELYYSENMTRRDLTVALYMLAGSPKVELPETSPYPDVQPSNPDYAAYIWARQKGITFGWIDGNFHPEAQLSSRSIVTFLYRYQRAQGKVSPILPTAARQPRNGSLPGSKDSENWATDLWEGSAFWRESRWAVQQHIWGYAEDWGRESFTWEHTTTYDLAVMLYRMEHGGSRLT
ncbi:S-layer homology domain-containing protein [Rothia mucilaginosa]|uniref:S-layer homology domain-containing protein n=1 Tax=Rothia mucilaginosa TaxID=43675 RepID=UPI0028DC263F|nr:S-layer homology domain-containing protein [Rothia mucilaginosa]